MTWVPRPPVTLWPASPRPRCSPGQRWGCQECPGCQDTLLILHSTLAPSPPAIFLVSGQQTVSALHQVGGGRQTEIRKRMRIISTFQDTPGFSPVCPGSPSDTGPGFGPRPPRRTTSRTTPRWRWSTRSSGQSSTRMGRRWWSPSQAGECSACVMCVSLVMWIIKWGETLSVQFWKKPRGLIEPIKRKTSHQVFIQTFLSKLISNASSGW